MAIPLPGGGGDDLQRSIGEQYALIKAERENDVEQWRLGELLRICKLPQERRWEAAQALLGEYETRRRRVGDENRVTESQRREHLMTLSGMGSKDEGYRSSEARISASVRLGTH
jgi:hypothetical protein